MKFIDSIKKILKDRKFVFICLFWVIISIQFIMGYNLQYKGHLPTDISNFLVDILKIILLSIVFIILNYCFIELYEKIKDKLEIEKTSKLKNNIQNNDKAKEEKVSKGNFFKEHKGLTYFLIIVICWIPVLLAFYPSIVSYDGGYQIREYLFRNKLNHHPILITKLYSLFYFIGIILQSPNTGMLFFSIFQMTFMAIVFSYTVKFIEEETNKKWIRNISILFYALFPLNQLFSMMTTKDVIFAVLMTIFIVNLYKNLKEKFKFTNYIYIVLIGITMLLSRNNSIYTLEVSLPFIILVLIKNKYKLLEITALFLIIIIGYSQINSLLYYTQKKEYESQGKSADLVNSDEGSMRTSIFSQAIGKIAKEKKYELTEDEKEKISYYFTDYEKIGKAYKYNIVDPASRYINVQNINKNKKEFYKFFLELGKKYTREYIESFLNLTRGYWYIGDTSFSEIWHDQKPETVGALELYVFPVGREEYAITEESKLPGLKELYLRMFGGNEYQNIPLLYMIFQPATYFYITFAFLLYAIYKKDKNNLVIAILLFTFFASCYMAACSIIRYMYPIITCTPIMFALAKKNKEE